MVTIIIPYNKDRGFLNKCKQSIWDQTYPYIEVLEAKGDVSVVKNINSGLKHAKGKFLKIVGEDDWLPDNAIEDLVNGMDGHPWICANAYNVYGADTTEEIPPLDKLNLKDMCEKNVIHNGTTMYRTALIRKIGGMDESLWTGEEYEMHLRLMNMGYLPGYVNKFVYFYREWNGQKSRTYRRTNNLKRDEELKRIQSLYSDKV